MTLCQLITARRFSFNGCGVAKTEHDTCKLFTFRDLQRKHSCTSAIVSKTGTPSSIQRVLVLGFSFGFFFIRELWYKIRNEKVQCFGKSLPTSPLIACWGQ